MKKLEIDRESLISLGSRVKKTRKTLGISQKDFAASLEMSGSYLSEIEHGNATPGHEFFYKVSLKYNISLDYLFHGIGSMIKEAPVQPGNKEKQYVENLQTIEDVVWLMEHSTMFKNTMMGFAQFEMDLHLGKKHAIRCYYQDFIHQFLNVFYEKNRKLMLKGKNIVPEAKLDFLYLPNPLDFLNDLKVKHLLFLFKRFFGPGKEEVKKAVDLLGKSKLEKRLADLELSERCRVVLRLAGLTKRSVYILKDFLFNIPSGFRGDLSELASQLRSEKSLLIDLVTLDSFTIEPEVTSTINYESGKYVEVK